MSGLSPGSGGSGGDDSDRATRTFLRFIDRDNPNLLGKVDFGGIVKTTGNAIVLTFFLMLVGLFGAAGDAVSALIGALGASISLAFSAPTLTLAEIQQEATRIASREVLDFGLVALPVSVVASVMAIGAVVLVFNVIRG